uniref:Uncharacterized protein n=1 Tax=Lepeophtheirus salmonis TaxID=72036 RepID=A0A0K2TGJ4_LEPSM
MGRVRTSLWSSLYNAVEKLFHNVEKTYMDVVYLLCEGSFRRRDNYSVRKLSFFS